MLLLFPIWLMHSLPPLPILPAPKCCSRCGVLKHRADFGTRTKAPDGLHPWCKPCSRAYSAAQYRKDPSKAIAYAKQWQRDNPGAVQIKNARWAAANPASQKRRSKRWWTANLDKCRVANTRRRATKLQATPAWADQTAIARLYALAVATGLEVDHIVPLQSDLVCGLHCAANLQLLPRKENISKGNRWWPQMW